jgi:hypothetical protein
MGRGKSFARYIDSDSKEWIGRKPHSGRNYGVNEFDTKPHPGACEHCGMMKCKNRGTSYSSFTDDNLIRYRNELRDLRLERGPLNDDRWCRLIGIYNEMKKRGME